MKVGFIIFVKEMIMIKNIALWIWQLPQNILGLLVILFTRSHKNKDENYWYTKKFNFGVSLGNYIIFGIKIHKVLENDIKHERGHQKQSLYLGWLYLLTIGFLSFIFNIYDSYFHKNWNYVESNKWYYEKLPWEHWADKLGGVTRNY